MSAIKFDRGPGENPWLLHASTVEEVDQYLTSSTVRCEKALVDDLLDLRNRLASPSERAA